MMSKRISVFFYVYLNTYLESSSLIDDSVTDIL